MHRPEGEAARGCSPLPTLLLNGKSSEDREAAQGCRCTAKVTCYPHRQQHRTK